MTNYEKMKLLVGQLQFFLDEGLIDEEHCGTIKEEVFSTMEVLSDCDEKYQEAFKEDMKEFDLMEGKTKNDQSTTESKKKISCKRQAHNR